MNVEIDLAPPRPEQRGVGEQMLRNVAKKVVRAYGMSTYALRPLPEFLIIGAKRCGTTSLYRYLLQSPHVLPLFPSSGRLPMAEDMKGVHYFDRAQGKSLAWYRSFFPSAAARWWRQRRVGEPVVAGEASPYYLFRPGAADWAAQVVPGARIIVILRDPVERAYSHYKEQRRNGSERLSFVDALAAEPQRLRGEEERLRTDPTYTSFSHEHHSYVAQGEYARGLRPWLARYPRDRILVLDSREFYEDSQAVLDRVAGRLGIPPFALRDRRAWNPTATSSPPPAIEERLREHFAPFDAELEALIEQPVGWRAR